MIDAFKPIEDVGIGQEGVRNAIDAKAPAIRWLSSMEG